MPAAWLAAALMIHPQPLPYAERLDSRPLDQINGIVIHCTETPGLATAREFGEQIVYTGSQTGNSGHFYIDLDGRIEQYVPLERVAHHVADMNDGTIGIELVNAGRWPDWLHSGSQLPDTPYPDAQIEALLELLQALEQQLPSLEWIAGHQDLDTRTVPASDNPDIQVPRKVDPGPMFPWGRVMAVSGLERMMVSRPPDRG